MGVKGGSSSLHITAKQVEQKVYFSMRGEMSRIVLSKPVLRKTHLNLPLSPRDATIPRMRKITS
jgi:hypothetical protein